MRSQTGKEIPDFRARCSSQRMKKTLDYADPAKRHQISAFLSGALCRSVPGCLSIADLSIISAPRLLPGRHRVRKETHGSSDCPIHEGGLSV